MNVPPGETIDIPLVLPHPMPSPSHHPVCHPLPPGETIDIPLVYDAPSRCSYSYEIVSGTGPIAFSVKGPPSSTSLLAEYKHSSEGTIEAALPPSLSQKGGGAVLLVTLDNTASTFSSIEVKCRVCLQPLAELQSLENYNARRALRALVVRKEETLAAHTRTYAKVGREAQELQATAARLREELYHFTKFIVII